MNKKFVLISSRNFCFRNFVITWQIGLLSTWCFLSLHKFKTLYISILRFFSLADLFHEKCVLVYITVHIVYLEKNNKQVFFMYFILPLQLNIASGGTISLLLYYLSDTHIWFFLSFILILILVIILLQVCDYIKSNCDKNPKWDNHWSRMLATWKRGIQQKRATNHRTRTSKSLVLDQ